MSGNGLAAPSLPRNDQSLSDRLADPLVVDSLNRLLDKLDSVAFFVESMDGFVRRSEVIADSVASSVAELRSGNHADAQEFLRKAPQRLKTGTDLADAASSLNVEQLSESRILERLTDPATLSAINQLLNQLPLLAAMGQMFESFLARGDTIADNVSDAFHELKLKDVNPEKWIRAIETLPKLQQIGDQVLESGLLGEGVQSIVDAGKSAIQAGLLDKPVVDTLCSLGKESAAAFMEAQQRPAPPVVGIFGMLKVMRDPDVQKSLGFFQAFAKAFAKNLK